LQNNSKQSLAIVSANQQRDASNSETNNKKIKHKNYDIIAENKDRSVI